MNIGKISLFAGVTVTTAIVAASALAARRKAEKRVSLPENFTLTAHTGCEGTADNSLKSISTGAEKGADIVEIDLHFLNDGTPVLSHDAPEENTSAEKIPTLDSAFELLSSLDVKMNVDVKSTANIAAVPALAEKYGVKEKIFFTGVDEKFVEAVRRDAPGIPYYLNVSVDKKKNTDFTYLSQLIEKVKEVGAIGINMNHKGASAELVRFFRSEGLLVSLWTANSRKTIHSCISFSPDNITTRKPSLFREIVGAND